MTAALQGVKVLVVEDEYLVAALMEDMLESAGCVVAGPIPRLAQALDAASSEACDVAVLDVNLAGERVYPVADILASGMFLSSLSPAMACCPASTPIGHASASRSRWQTCSTRCRISSKLRLQVIRPLQRVGVWRG